MATARDFVTMALKEAGVLGVGQTPLAEDINDAFTLLNRMLAQWQKKRWLIPSLFQISAAANGAKSNLIGPGQFYNAARPDKIQFATFRQLNNNNPNNVSFPLTPIWSYEDYMRITLKELNSFPQYIFYDGAFPYGNVFVWPIPDQNYEVTLLLKGPIGFTIQLQDGNIAAAGLGYVNGSYLDIPFINLSGFGSGGSADVTVAGGIVTAIVIHQPGDGYKVNDNLTLDNTLMGGAGSGFIWKVIEVTDTLDAEFNMPEEYHEAVHYNLCIRLCSMYQYPVNPVQAGLAKLSLNTIKVANVQISALKMPSQYQNKSGQFYIYNAEAH